MRAIWKALLNQFTRDDLFVRVLFAIYAFGIGGLGVALCLAAFNPESTIWILLLMVVCGLLLIFWGCLLLTRTFFAPENRWSKLVGKYYPDDFDVGVIIIVVPVLLVAVPLTLILRILGIRGHVT